MKITALLALASLSTVALAGHPMTAPAGKKTIIPQEACFGETELQLDIYGAYSTTDSSHGSGFGGGIGINYYFTRNFGVGLDATLVEGDTGEVFQGTVNLLARYPFELGHICLAPYAKVGGGVEVDGSPEGILSVGGGIEWRITPRMGVFGEGSYNFAHENDYTQIKAGLRFVF